MYMLAAYISDLMYCLNCLWVSPNDMSYLVFGRTMSECVRFSQECTEMLVRLLCVGYPVDAAAFDAGPLLPIRKFILVCVFAYAKNQCKPPYDHTMWLACGSALQQQSQITLLHTKCKLQGKQTILADYSRYKVTLIMTNISVSWSTSSYWAHEATFYLVI